MLSRLRSFLSAARMNCLRGLEVCDQDDGLEAFDFLAGWEGTKCRRATKQFRKGGDTDAPSQDKKLRVHDRRSAVN